MIAAIWGYIKIGFMALANLRAIFSLVTGLISLVKGWLAKIETDKLKKKLDEAAEKIKKANEIVDDKERLDAKAKAACELEKLANPSSDCDRPR